MNFNIVQSAFRPPLKILYCSISCDLANSMLHLLSLELQLKHYSSISFAKLK